MLVLINTTMSNWIYNGEEFTSEMIGDMVGFVYCVTNLQNGMKYIGQKRFFRKVTRPPLKGKKRRRISSKESAWKTYCGSSDMVSMLVKKHGIDIFHREILHLCMSRGELNYRETEEQFTRQVLLRPDEYYNGIINCRINKSHVTHMIIENNGVQDQPDMV
jgi:hypothetical protein